MKPPGDDMGLDLLREFKRPRGRPVTGSAKSAAERQQARRARLKASGGEVITVTVDMDVVAALRRFVESRKITQGEAVSRILRDHLLRKR
jgi:hypothetical protein